MNSINNKSNNDLQVYVTYTSDSKLRLNLKNLTGDTTVVSKNSSSDVVIANTANTYLYVAVWHLNTTSGPPNSWTYYTVASQTPHSTVNDYDIGVSGTTASGINIVITSHSNIGSFLIYLVLILIGLAILAASLYFIIKAYRGRAPTPSTPSFGGGTNILLDRQLFPPSN